MIVLTIGTVIELNTDRGVSDGFVALLIGASAVFGVSNAAITMKHGGKVESQQVSEQDADAAKVVDYALTAAEQAQMMVKETEAKVQAQQEQIEKMTQILKGILTIKQQ
jgi:hypothetical protein